MHLAEHELSLLAKLPAHTLGKTRHSVPPFGIDVFDGTLQGLVMAEAEFDSATAADALTLPSFILHEVSSDPRFTGGQLVCASRQDISNWLSDYNISL